MICKNCGESYLMAEDGNQYFCPKCQVKKEQRDEFRKIMDSIEKINKMDVRERSFFSGFSWAELERFSLIMKKLIKANHLPNEDKDFVNFYAKKELEELKKTFIF